MFKSWFLLGCILLAGFAVIIRSEDDIVVENEEDLKANAKINVEDVPLGGSEEPIDTAASLASPDADTTLYFTHPTNTKDIPTNQPIRMLIGFRNKGQQPIMVDWLDASLRYPMDFNYIITNFTSVRFSHEVLPGQEATFAYGFLLSDAFHSRPFTLNINLHYHDTTGRIFTSAVHNETINVFEVEEGFDSQTFFLYVIFAAIVVLVGVAGQQYFGSKQKKRPTASKSSSSSNGVESGTSKSSDVDYDWLPESTLRAINKGPKSPKAKQSTTPQSRSPQQSPKAAKKTD